MVVPDKIKRNFIYRRLWNDIHREEENAVILWIGNVGKGKSTQAITFCKDLDPSFGLNRIVYSVEELLQLTRTGELKKGSAILFDEIAGSEEGADSRKSMSHINQILSYLTTTIRSDGYIIVYCVPLLSQIDKRERLIGVKGLFTSLRINRRTKKSYARFNWVLLSSKEAKVYYPIPVYKTWEGLTKKLKEVIFNFPKDKEFIKAYKEKKERFKADAQNRWHLQLHKETKKTLKQYYDEATKKIDLLVNEKGKVLLAELQVHLEDISERDAVKLRTVLQNQITKGQLTLKLDTHSI